MGSIKPITHDLNLGGERRAVNCFLCESAKIFSDVLPYAEIAFKPYRCMSMNSFLSSFRHAPRHSFQNLRELKLGPFQRV